MISSFFTSFYFDNFHFESVIYVSVKTIVASRNVKKVATYSDPISSCYPTKTIRTSCSLTEIGRWTRDFARQIIFVADCH